MGFGELKGDAAFLIHWSEGDPMVVVAADFGSAISVYHQVLLAQYEPDELATAPDQRQRECWLESINQIGDEVYVAT